jgi:hypothetical protein
VADDKSLRVSVEVHAELASLADDHKQPIGSLADALLEYGMATIERVEQALRERQAQGSRRARNRRGGDGSFSSG